MASRMEEFRDFVKRYPNVRSDVLNGKKTWQQIYEDWVILGENDTVWQPYKSSNNNQQNTSQKPGSSKRLEDLLSSDNLKTIMGYIKKINPDTLSKTLNTIQKVLQITQSFGSNSSSGLYNANYNSWWD